MGSLRRCISWLFSFLEVGRAPSGCLAQGLSQANFHRHLMSGQGVNSQTDKPPEVVSQVSLSIMRSYACSHLPKGQCDPNQTFHSGHTWEERTPASFVGCVLSWFGTHSFVFCCNEENLYLSLAAAETPGLSMKPKRSWLHPSWESEFQGQLEVTGCKQQKLKCSSHSVGVYWKDTWSTNRKGGRSRTRIRKRQTTRTGLGVPGHKQRQDGL